MKEECGAGGGAGLPFEDFKEEDLKGDLGDFGNGDYHSLYFCKSYIDPVLHFGICRRWTNNVRNKLLCVLMFESFVIDF